MTHCRIWETKVRVKEIPAPDDCNCGLQNWTSMGLRNERLDIVACAEHGSYELRRRRNEERRNEERRKEERGKDVRLTLDSR